VKAEKDGTETLLATGTSVIVCYSYTDKKPVPVPASWSEPMKNYSEEK
jgi:acyl-CoA thioesterase FadM